MAGFSTNGFPFCDMRLREDGPLSCLKGMPPGIRKRPITVPIAGSNSNKDYDAFKELVGENIESFSTTNIVICTRCYEKVITVALQ